MTRAGKRDIDRDELRDVWQRQAADLGLDARALVAEAEARVRSRLRPGGRRPGTWPARTSGASVRSRTGKARNRRHPARARTPSPHR